MTEFVGSHLKDFPRAPGVKENRTGFGQNGSTVPSSDLPGQHTTSGFLPANDGTANANEAGDEARLANIQAGGSPAHDGMKNRSTSIEAIPSTTNHRARVGKR